MSVIDELATELARLARDPGGFLAVRPTLQVLNDPDVFASGDCAGLVETPREPEGPSNPRNTTNCMTSKSNACGSKSRQPLL